MKPTKTKKLKGMDYLSSTFQGGKYLLKKGFELFLSSNPEKPSEITEEEKSLGITWQLIYFVQHISQHPVTWVSFPLQGDSLFLFISKKSKYFTFFFSL